MQNCLSDDSNNLVKNSNVWDMFKEFNDENISDEFENFNCELDNDLQESYGCEECKTFTLVYQDGHHVCNNCGLIQQKKLSHEAEYRFYGDNDNKSSNTERVGLPSNNMLPES